MKKTLVAVTAAAMTAAFSVQAFAAGQEPFLCTYNNIAGTQKIFQSLCEKSELFNLDNLKIYIGSLNCTGSEDGKDENESTGTENGGNTADKPVNGGTGNNENTADKPTNGGTENNTNDQKGYNSAYEQKVVELVNKERAAEGLSPLSISKDAEAAADVRAKEIVQSFSHTRPNGTNCFSVLNENGVSYKSAGENIAMGQKTPEQVVAAWMASPSHRENIMSGKFTKIGVSCYTSGSTTYWTQMFLG